MKNQRLRDVLRVDKVKVREKGYGYTLTVTVKKIKGKCDVGHKVGDKIVFDGLRVRGKMCFSALATLMPTIYAFAWGAEFPWNKNRDTTTIPCPDDINQVVFEIKRDRRHPWYSEKQV